MASDKNFFALILLICIDLLIQGGWVGIAQSCVLFFVIFKKFYKDMSPFCGAIYTPVLDFWWHLLWVSKPEWVLPYSSLAEAVEHGSRAISSTYLQGICGTRNLFLFPQRMLHCQCLYHFQLLWFPHLLISLFWLWSCVVWLALVVRDFPSVACCIGLFHLTSFLLGLAFSFSACMSSLFACLYCWMTAKNHLLVSNFCFLY